MVTSAPTALVVIGLPADMYHRTALEATGHPRVMSPLTDQEGFGHHQVMFHQMVREGTGPRARKAVAAGSLGSKHQLILSITMNLLRFLINFEVMSS